MLAGRFLEKPILLLENATNDGDLYIELFSHEARRRGIRSLAYEVANGGGGTTFQEVYRLAKLQHVVVCICDHDKLSPYSQNSETFRKAASTAKHSDLVGTVVTTPGREVENFLPLDLVLDIVPNFPIDQRKKLEDLITVQGPVQPRDCLWLFFDVKEGICSNKLLKKCKSIDAQRWAEEKYKIDLQVDKIAITGFGETVVAQLLDDGALLAKLYKFTRSQYWLHHFAPWFDAFLPFLQSRLTSRV
ncbi:hypothetical protein EE36_14008 [Sulfitobacter sp. EE-36]|nr:hypothetical protein EE36_14008 [Sulfitobacter sp. EE-36]